MPLTIICGIFFFLTGVIMGSFYNVCIYRIPREESVVYPASHCTSCGHKLVSKDLFPLFSWMFLLGKCRYCKAKISVRYPIVELLTGIIFVGSYLSSGISAALLFNIMFASVLIIIAFIDIDFRIIPDRFIIIGIVAAAGSFMFAEGLTWKEALIGSAIGGGVLLLVDLAGRLFFKKEGMGFGDVKLMFMAGLYLGIAGTAVALLIAIWSGAIAGVVILRVKKDKEDKYMPFGPFLSLGCMTALFWGEKLTALYLSLFI